MYLFIDTGKVSDNLKQRCMTRAEFAAASGVSQFTAAHMFSCRYRRMSSRTTNNIAKFLDVDLRDLAEDKARVLAYMIDLETKLDTDHSIGERQRSQMAKEVSILKKMLGKDD